MSSVPETFCLGGMDFFSQELDPNTHPSNGVWRITRFDGTDITGMYRQVPCNKTLNYHLNVLYENSDFNVKIRNNACKDDHGCCTIYTITDRAGNTIVTRE
jgi:hypothetical protein